LIAGQFPDGRPLGQIRGDGWVFVSIPRAREEFGEVCCAIDSHVDRTFLIEVFLVPLRGSFFERGIMNKFRQNSARILASRKECYGQKNRSAQ
jgi:hypothetical protein